jgi:hypothetical protein
MRSFTRGPVSRVGGALWGLRAMGGVLLSEAAPALSDALTLDGFDFDTAIAAIEGSELSEVSKRAATAALEGARANPDLLPAALDQARNILGLE